MKTSAPVLPVAIIRSCPFCGRALVFVREEITDVLKPRECPFCAEVFLYAAGKSAGSLMILKPGRDS